MSDLPPQTVQLRIPASGAYLSLLRTVVGGCAGREHFTLDQVDDLRMAVDEAVGQLLRSTTGGAVDLTVTPDEEALEVRVAATTPTQDPVIDPESFASTILQALTDELDVAVHDGQTVVTMRKARLPEMRGKARS